MRSSVGRRTALLCTLSAFGLLAADSGEVWTESELAHVAAELPSRVDASNVAFQILGEYGSHLLVQIYRKETGPAESHDDWTDFYVVRSGSATLLMGGALKEPYQESAGETRGTGIEGGGRVPLNAGDVVNIPPEIAHQVLVSEGSSITYLILKVKKAH